MNQNVFSHEEESLWQYHYKEFEGKEIVFRQNLITGLIQMKVTDAMAQANGYEDLNHMRECMGRGMGTIVILPEWMNVSEPADLYSHLN